MTANFALLTLVGALVDFFKARLVDAVFASTILIWTSHISVELHYTLILVKYLSKNV